MRCRHLFSFVLVVFSVFCFGLFTTQNSYAVEDISVTYNSTVSQWADVFPNCNSDCLNTYSYLIISISNYVSDVYYFNFYTRYDGSNQVQIRLSTFSPLSIYQLRFNGSPNSFLSFASSINFSDFGSVTFTLTNSYQSCPPSPSGDLSITENGTYDVTNYSSATVNVASSEIIQGNYHDDLVNINQSIIVCGAILLVLYFFYCIYRLIIKNSGVH